MAEGAYRSHGRTPFCCLIPRAPGYPRMAFACYPAAGIAHAYVSCDPSTLARDLKGLLAAAMAVSVTGSTCSRRRTTSRSLPLQRSGQEDGKTASRQETARSDCSTPRLSRHAQGSSPSGNRPPKSGLIHRDRPQPGRRGCRGTVPGRYPAGGTGSGRARRARVGPGGNRRPLPPVVASPTDGGHRREAVNT